MINIPKCTKSFSYAFNGIKLLIKSENNARVHLLATVLVLAGGFFFCVTKAEWLWLLLAIALVWITEAINTVIEKLVDFISPDYNIKAGEVKDIASAVVLIAAIFALSVGVIIFLPYVVNCIKC